MKILKNELKTHVLRLSVFALATMLSAPALASHEEIHDSRWFTYQYNDDDDTVLFCNALGVIHLGAGLYLHVRSLVWMFQESNGVFGLQIGGAGAIPDVQDPTDPTAGGGPGYIVTFSDPYGPPDPATGHPGCPNGDTVVAGAKLRLPLW